MTVERGGRLSGGVDLLSHWDRGDGAPACGAIDPKVRPLTYPENVTCVDCRKIAQEERERYEQEHS